MIASLKIFCLTRLFSFHASGNFGLCFSLDTKTCISSKVGWFPTSVWKAIWYSGTDSPVGKRKEEKKNHRLKGRARASRWWKVVSKLLSFEKFSTFPPKVHLHRKSRINCKWIQWFSATSQRTASSNFAGWVALSERLTAWGWHLICVKRCWLYILMHFTWEEAQQDYKSLHMKCSCLTTDRMLHDRWTLYALSWEEDGGCDTISHVKF